jgi:hypothetical protein
LRQWWLDDVLGCTPIRNCVNAKASWRPRMRCVCGAKGEGCVGRGESEEGISELGCGIHPKDELDAGPQCAVDSLNQAVCAGTPKMH